MKNVLQILGQKPAQIFSVTANTTVLDTLKMMTDKNVSAILVMDGDDLQGIFTERDYARKIILHGKTSKDTLIGEVMTSELIIISPTDSIDLCMQMMTEKHIRHLPVKDGDKIVGMISIGDLVKFIIADQQQTILQLESYINS
jgi:CBS domain-containing protein